jgi:hypothetical protein
MTSLALSLGPLFADGFVVRRSAINWTCEDRHLCRPNEVIGFCSITLEAAPGQRATSTPLSDELDFQVAIAPRHAGRLRIGDSRPPGGYLGVHGLHTWNSDEIVAYLEADTEANGTTAEKSTLRLLMVAGRRVSGLADVDAGFLPGWHSRSRAWWGDTSPKASLLCIGICDAAGIIRGTETPFIETFEAGGAEPAHVVYVPDHPVLPCAPVLLDQLLRTPAQNLAIAADLGAAIGSGKVAATADDWMFAGVLTSWLQRSPLRDTYDVVTPVGLQHLGPPDAILLSLTSEVSSVLRHKKLGYSLQMLRHRQASAGPAIRAWLSSEFETVKRSIEDIRRDYRKLVDVVRQQTGARVMILNRMSTSGYEDIVSYAPFSAPMSETLENIASKEMNLMLHDLASECDVSIIDVDALAAELGGAQHLPDGIHHSAAMQSVLRSAILGEWLVVAPARKRA